MIKKMLIDGQLEDVVIPVDVFQLGAPADGIKDEWCTSINCGRYVRECASYDPEDHRCLEKDRECFQDGVEHCVCLYARDWILPGIEEEPPRTRRVVCKCCGILFEKPRNSKVTLCPVCRKRRKREQKAEYMRKQRKVEKNSDVNDI